MAGITIAGTAAQATVSPVAGMLIDAAFTIGGTTHRPFARAPWIDADGVPERGLEDQPGHLRMLGGEFVAVPFGSVGAPEGLSPEWSEIVPVEHPARPHGPAADEEWTVLDQAGTSVTLGLQYPEESGIERLERTVAVREDAPALDFSLRIIARRPAEIAVGLHPILRLPTEPRSLRLDAPFSRGYTYPGLVWPGSGVTTPAAEFDRLDAVPAREGFPVDLSRLPLEEPVEDVVLLADASGPVTATFADTGTVAQLDWDRAAIPHVMLWISDRVLQEEPWRGRYRGLGVEPIAAAFDFPDEVSTAPNPLSRADHRTSLAITPASPVTVRYSVEVSSVDR